jgi:hypothetical protein
VEAFLPVEQSLTATLSGFQANVNESGHEEPMGWLGGELAIVAGGGGSAYERKV